MKLARQPSLWQGRFRMTEFSYAGNLLKIIFPTKPLPETPWAWKGEFLDAFPKVELALLESGFHIAYYQAPDQFGSPEVVKQWNEAYALLTETYGFSRKPALIGLSRGGLYCYQFAIAHPEKVACIYGDAPVCDLRSWPGGLGSGPGSPEDWEKAMHVFRFSSREEALAWRGNPVDNLAPLAAAKIPLLHVFGDADETVPWEENTGMVADRYRALDGQIKLISKPGGRHHPHGLEDPTPIVDFIKQHTLAIHNHS